MTYRELQTALKDLRDNHGFKLQCKLNQSKEVLLAEFARITDIQSDMNAVSDTDTIVKHHFEGQPVVTTNVGSASVSEAIAFIDRNYPGSLIDEVISPRDDFRFSTVFAPKDNKFTVHSVVTALNLHGYQTTHDKDSVTIYDVEGWISVSKDKLFFNFDGTDEMKRVASMGYVPIIPSGAIRYSVYAFNEFIREYCFQESFHELEPAKTYIKEELHRTDEIDLRLENWQNSQWRCIEHCSLG